MTIRIVSALLALCLALGCGRAAEEDLNATPSPGETGLAKSLPEASGDTPVEAAPEAVAPEPPAPPAPPPLPPPRETVEAFLAIIKTSPLALFRQGRKHLTRKARECIEKLDIPDEEEVDDEEFQGKAPDFTYEIVGEKVENGTARVEVRFENTQNMPMDAKEATFHLRKEEDGWKIWKMKSGENLVDFETAFDKKESEEAAGEGPETSKPGKPDAAPPGPGQAKPGDIYVIYQPHRIYKDDKVLIWHSPSRRKRKFLLAPGTQVKLLKAVDGAKYGEPHDMYLIQTQDGREGWVPAGWCRKMNAPPEPVDARKADVKKLVLLLKAYDAGQRRDAALELGNRGDMSAIQPLIAALGDDDPQVRSNAAWSLGQLTGENHGEDAARWRKWWAREAPAVQCKQRWSAAVTEADKAIRSIHRGHDAVSAAKTDQERKKGYGRISAGMIALLQARENAADLRRKFDDKLPGLPPGEYRAKTEVWLQTYETALASLPADRARTFEMARTFETIWKGAIDGYYDDLLKDPDNSANNKDIAKRLDEGSKAAGFKDWMNCCTTTAESSAELYKTVVQRMTRYSVQKATEVTRKLTERAKKKAKVK